MLESATHGSQILALKSLSKIEIGSYNWVLDSNHFFLFFVMLNPYFI